MTEKDIIREAMALRKWSQATLAQEAGFKSQSNINGFLNATQKSMRVDTMVRMLSAMGCEVVVRDKMGSKQEWVLDFASTSSATPTIEEQLKSGTITFEQAVAQGWKPSKEMLDKLLS